MSCILAYQINIATDGSTEMPNNGLAMYIGLAICDSWQMTPLVVAMWNWWGSLTQCWMTHLHGCLFVFPLILPCSTWDIVDLIVRWSRHACHCCLVATMVPVLECFLQINMLKCFSDILDSDGELGLGAACGHSVCPGVACCSCSHNLLLCSHQV